ncbi:MAG TPA: LuxR family transcriptional regulator [Longimicrobiaceae bacterium]
MSVLTEAAPRSPMRMRRRNHGRVVRQGIGRAESLRFLTEGDDVPAGSLDYPAGRRAPEFLDRFAERAVLHQLVAHVRAGQSQVLVLRGEAGCGKTALLEQLSETATGCRIAWATGVESEMELAFAGLHSLSAGLLSNLDKLPEPQREALSTAFGMSSGPPPDRFLVGLAVLSLLSERAEDQPLVCIVDDAQWLDPVSLQTLAFVARRLLAEGVGLVFAVRDHDSEGVLDGLPELEIPGLDAEHARMLLDAIIPGPLDEQVKTRILEETRGNPLALIELPSCLTPAELAGGMGFPDAHQLASRIERGFVQRSEELPRDAQLLLLTAAAEPTGDPGLLWRAAERLGLGGEAGVAAETAGLIDLGVRVRFPHPLVRSAIYAASNPSDRRDIHRALADVTDPLLDPDRRAWHRAHATALPDEEAATEMMVAADRAQARGGLSAAAAFMQRASELTPDAAVRVERTLTAAQTKLDVADFASASTLVAAAGLGPLDDLQRARLERLHAQIVFATQRGRDAPAVLLNAARRLESLDDALARETYLEAISSALFAGRLGTGPHARELAEKARVLLPQTPLSVADLLLDGLVKRFTEGYAASVAPLTRALRSLVDADDLGSHHRWLWLACRLAQELWDDELWSALAARGARVGRASGRLSLLAHSVNHLAAFHVHSGAFAQAALLIDEANMITQATRLPRLTYAECKLDAARGDPVRMQAISNLSLEDAASRGEGWAFDLYWSLSAFMYNGRGQYDRALSEARQAREDEDVIAYGSPLVELMEAAVRVGDFDEAAAALDVLSTRTRAAGTEWALGIEARCRGLLTDDEACYEESIERLTRSHAAIDLARSHLVYGEWLRRANRRVDARKHLRTAYESFRQMGAAAFAERARRELLATGETVRRRAGEGVETLTPQEVHVAMMACEGHTNPQIGARLFISARTVEYHLRKVFRKLGIAGRRELRDALAEVTQQTAAGLA